MALDTVHLGIETDEDETVTNYWETYLDGEMLLHVEIDYPTDREKEYGITWYPKVPMNEGFQVVRNSYDRLKTAYVEPRELEKTGRVLEEYDGGFAVGPVTFCMARSVRGQSRHATKSGITIAAELSKFMNPSSFQSDGSNPLSWMRVNTEYLSYYLAIGANSTIHEIGILGLYDITDELTELVKNTSGQHNDSYWREFRDSVKGLLREFPAFEKR